MLIKALAETVAPELVPLGLTNERPLRATLYEVQVVIHVKKRHSESESTHDRTVHLTSGPSVGDDHSDKNHLYESNLGHDKPLFDSLYEFTGLGGGVHGTFTVNWHFYYLPRK
jgi:hypothetical protein